MTGGGKDRKKPLKSNSYFYKNLSNIKYFSRLFIEKVKNLYKKLTFLRYDRIGGAGSRIQDDLGAGFFKYSSNTVCEKIRKDFRAANIFRDLLILIKKILLKIKCKPSNRSILIPPAGASCKGSILIEFAVCMPVLIILLYYINDLSKLKRYYDQTEFVAQQMANILQNLAKKRAAEGTVLQPDDFSHAASLAFLSIYPGKTMYSSTDGKQCHEFIHFPFFSVYYVQGTSNGKAKCLWGKQFTCSTNTAPPWILFRNITRNVNWSIVTYSSNEITASSIYPTLKVEENRPKVILETSIYWYPPSKDKNGIRSANNAQEIFGLRLVNPKKAVDLYFNSVVIFTPNDGFPKTRPQ